MERLASAFLKGIRLDEKKRPSPRRITVISVPEQVRIPLAAATPEEGLLTVPESDIIRFQPVCVPADRLPTYSPVCGKVLRLETVCHPFLGELCCAVTAVAPRQKALRGIPPAAEGMPETETILRVAGSAAIVDELDGMPIYDKIKNMQAAGTECLAAAAFDDDPYFSSAEAAFSCDPEAALDGLYLAAAAAGVRQVRIICPEETGRRKLKGENAAILQTPGSRYPVWPLLSRKPAFQKAELIGIQACIALSQAVRKGIPQTDTVLSVSGEGVQEPKNVKVLIGTPVRAVLEACGVDARSRDMAVVMGSALNGAAVQDFSAPVTASARGLLVIPAVEKRESVCIGCGACERTCPAGLSLWRAAELLRRKSPSQSHLLEWSARCLGCNTCAAGCPAGIGMPDLLADAMRKKEADNG